MVENREAWKKLIDKVDKDQEFFNKQMDRIKAADEVPDSESPLIGPVQEYAR